MLDQLARIVTWRVVFIATCIIVLAVFIGIQVIDRNYQASEVNLQFRLSSYCTSNLHSTSDCFRWAELEMTGVNRAKINACNTLSPTLDAPFGDCLRNERINP